MTAAENMASILTKSGVYKLTGDSPVDWELAAYGAGFQALAEQVSALEQEMLIGTAPAERLAQWEKLCLPQALSASLEVRRAVLGQCLASRGGPVAQDDLPGLLLAAGIKGTAAEGTDGLTVTVEEYLLPEALAKARLGRLLPANLAWTAVMAAS